MGVFGPKKLKPINYDTVSYITIETEDIKNATDKHMISSYCLNKIQLVEWYIKVLKSGSDKYIVPHDLYYLEGIRDQLKECHRKIMNVKITPKSQGAIGDGGYSDKYRG